MMEDKKYITKILSIGLGFIALFSCSKIDLEDFAELTLITDWSNRTASVPIPTSYNVIIGEHSFVFEGFENILPKVELGVHTAYVYNNAEHITIKGTIASVKQSNETVEPMPGWLFSSLVSFENKNNLVEVLRTTMRQEVRELEIILRPTGGSVERISKIEAHLEGVAGEWNFLTNSPVGTGKEVPLHFEKQSNGDWKAIIRLLGIVEGNQEINGTVHFAEGRPLSLDLYSDMTQDLKDFNKEKHNIITMQADVETAHEAGFSTIINDWIRVEKDGIAW